MKNLLVGALVTITTIATQSAIVHAQTVTPNAAKPARVQSAPLVTQPASLKPISVDAGRSAKPYTTDQLNSILGTMQANPQPTQPAPKNSIESLIQRFSVSTPKRTTTIDPIDFFKPPALDGGVKIPIQQ
ncbi:MAG: hypothetical protein KME27_15995 [Lyngbya sp. HA4199-MV5]|nr:hypothetical protein [Lyngbya sp. HA4199-MV5]